MRFSTMLATTAAAVTAGVLQAAAAEPRCLSQGEAFGVGQYACLNVGDKGRLALCEVAEGAMNWREVRDHCPGGNSVEPSPPAEQAANCLANGQTFGTGRLACLRVGDNAYLARCDLILNSSSWTRVDDECPGNPPLDAGQAPEDGSWKPFKKPRELLDRLLGRS